MSQEDARRRDRLELAQLWADLVSKVLGAVALIAAGAWTYSNFTVERTHDPTMQIAIRPEVQVLSGDRVLLNADVMLENVGRVAIMPKFATSEETRDLGLEISVVEMDAHDHGTEVGETPWFDWTTGSGQPRPVLYKRNLLATNEDFRNRRYQLNPGVKYREPFACLVEKDKLYAIRARFWTNEGSIADLVYVHTFAGDPQPAAEIVAAPQPSGQPLGPILPPDLAEPTPADPLPTETAERANQLRRH
jgi:hypothetical protein